LKFGTKATTWKDIGVDLCNKKKGGWGWLKWKRDGTEFRTMKLLLKIRKEQQKLKEISVESLALNSVSFFLIDFQIHIYLLNSLWFTLFECCSRNNWTLFFLKYWFFRAIRNPKFRILSKSLI
jgi:hypothetical protein